MRKPAKTAALLFGLGVGVAAGPSLGTAAVWSGVAVAALGVVLSLVGATEPALVEELRGDPGEAAAGPRPSFSHLGTHVEKILRLAEEQADAILVAARKEAEAIVQRAHEQAAGGTERDT